MTKASERKHTCMFSYPSQGIACRESSPLRSGEHLYVSSDLPECRPALRPAFYCRKIAQLKCCILPNLSYKRHFFTQCRPEIINEISDVDN